jgi:hypothetical protein
MMGMTSRDERRLYIHLQRAITSPDKFSMTEGKQGFSRVGIKFRFKETLADAGRVSTIGVKHGDFDTARDGSGR